MIGSPAARGAVASLTGAGRACRATASAESAVSTAIAASASVAERLQRRVVLPGFVLARRLAMCFPAGPAYSATAYPSRRGSAPPVITPVTGSIATAGLPSCVAIVGAMQIGNSAPGLVRFGLFGLTSVQ